MWNQYKVTLKFDPSQTQFPIEILNQWNLTELEIIGGSFTYFPEDISVLKNLEKFSLISTNVDFIPRELFELPCLKYLNLKNNKITHLPSLSKRNSIQTLILSRNNILEIDNFFRFFADLSTLDLGHNQLKQLSKDIVSLNKLRRLVLDSNKLKELPITNNQMPFLQHLSLDDNIFNNEEKSRIQKNLNITFD